MRDAFGGVFTTNLLLVFIFIYVAFTAVSLNYAKAFKLKNAVIDFVEQNEIIDLANIDADLEDKLDAIIDAHSYNKTCDSIGKKEGKQKSVSGKTTEYCHRGILIKKDREEKLSGTSKNTKKEAKNIYYQIKTYASWELGALNTFLALAGEREDDVLAGTWSVKGEAKVVYKSK